MYAASNGHAIELAVEVVHQQTLPTQKRDGNELNVTSWDGASFEVPSILAINTSDSLLPNELPSWSHTGASFLQWPHQGAYTFGVRKAWDKPTHHVSALASLVTGPAAQSHFRAQFMSAVTPRHLRAAPLGTRVLLDP